MVRTAIALVCALAISSAAARDARAAAPRVAIVMCQDSYDADWTQVQPSVLGLVGVAGLLGVPYDTVELEQLLSGRRHRYSSLWFSSCPVVRDRHYPRLVRLVREQLRAGRSIFIDGPLAEKSRRGTRDTSALDQLLGVERGGYQLVKLYVIGVSGADHEVTRRAGVDHWQQLSQGLADGLDIVRPREAGMVDSTVLLELFQPGGSARLPYLIVTENRRGGRVAAVSGYGHSAGPATGFRNEHPRGFFDNRVLPYLLSTLEWLELRDGDPMVGLQLSHAPMTAVGRIDGDWSGRVEATVDSLDYADALARDTGLASAYGLVSSFVPATGWKQYRDGVARVERRGGAVGSHSHTHNRAMSAELAKGDWAAETGRSLATIRKRLGSKAATRVFINPGDGIHLADYGRFAHRFDLFMTHGFERMVPYATGVIGFGASPTAVVSVVPVSDNNWLYSNDWAYSVASAATNQAALLDYYQNTIGRGVLYNQMWHDYAITDGARPIHFYDTPSVRPLFDVNRKHFAENPVYMPAIDELVGKLHVARSALHRSYRFDRSTIIVEIDYAGVSRAHRRHVAGMGLRVGGETIAAVTIDGARHYAFRGDTVMLPAPRGRLQRVVVRLGQPARRARLGFASRAIDSVERRGEELRWSWRGSQRLMRSCADGPDDLIILGADAQARADADSLCADVRAGGKVTSLATARLGTGLVLQRSERRVEAVTVSDGQVTLEVADGPAGSMTVGGARAPAAVTINGATVATSAAAGGRAIAVPAGAAVITVPRS